MAINFLSSSGVSAKPSNFLKPTKHEVGMKEAQAACLYQPVSGTSNTYKTFCYSSTLVVAVRVVGSKVSLRVESRPGSTLSAGGNVHFVKHMQTLGLSKKDGYMSGHMSFKDLTLWHVLAPVAFNPCVDWTEVARDLTHF